MRKESNGDFLDNRGVPLRVGQKVAYEGYGICFGIIRKLNAESVTVVNENPRHDGKISSHVVKTNRGIMVIDFMLFEPMEIAKHILEKRALDKSTEA